MRQKNGSVSWKTEWLVEITAIEKNKEKKNEKK